MSSVGEEDRRIFSMWDLAQNQNGAKIDEHVNVKVEVRASKSALFLFRHPQIASESVLRTSPRRTLKPPLLTSITSKTGRASGRKLCNCNCTHEPRSVDQSLSRRVRTAC
jgi:hypothetical protein